MKDNIFLHRLWYGRILLDSVLICLIFFRGYGPDPTVTSKLNTWLFSLISGLYVPKEDSVTRNRGGLRSPPDSRDCLRGIGSDKEVSTRGRGKIFTPSSTSLSFRAVSVTHSGQFRLRLWTDWDLCQKGGRGDRGVRTGQDTKEERGWGQGRNEQDPGGILRLVILETLLGIFKFLFSLKFFKEKLWTKFCFGLDSRRDSSKR